MKLGKFIYFCCVIIMASLSAIMITHNMILIGGLFGIIAFAAIINYIDIVQTNRSYNTKPAKRRRAEYFSKLSEEEKQEFFSNIEKQL